MNDDERTNHKTTTIFSFFGISHCVPPKQLTLAIFFPHEPPTTTTPPPFFTPFSPVLPRHGRFLGGQCGPVHRVRDLCRFCLVCPSGPVHAPQFSSRGGIFIRCEFHHHVVFKFVFLLDGRDVLVFVYHVHLLVLLLQSLHRGLLHAARRPFALVVLQRLLPLSSDFGVVFCRPIV